MNLLSQVLPGVRELRTPLAVGTLLALTGFLTWDLAPDGIATGEVVKRLTELRRVLPDPAQGSLAILGIYIVGLLFAELGGLVLRMVRTVAAGAVFLLVVVLVAVLFLRSIQFVVIAVLVFATATWRRWAVDKTIPLQGHAALLWHDFTEWSLRNASRAWQEVADTWNPVGAEVRRFMTAEVERVAGSQPEYFASLIDDLTDDDVPAVARVVDLRLGDIQRAAPENAAVERARDIKRLLRQARRDKQLIPPIRSAIKLRIADPNYRKVFVLSEYVDTNLLRKELRNRLRSARVLLRDKHEALWSEYDRLRAEAEFRLAIALPVGALLASIARLIGTDLRFSQSTMGYIYLGCLLSAALMTYLSDQREEQADSLLFDSLRQQLIENRDLPALPAGYIRVRASENPRSSGPRSRSFPWRRQRPWVGAWRNRERKQFQNLIE